MNALELFINSLLYVADQNMFLQSMGFTTAIAIFIGALLYDGNTDRAKKGLVAIGSYGAMLAWTTFVRVYPNAAERGFKYSDGRPLAGFVTILYITAFWMLGMAIGVTVFKIIKKNGD